MDFTLDATILAVLEPSFTLDAWIIGGKQLHSRETDHYGVDLASNVVIDSAIGRWPARSTVQDVLQDLFDRMTALESSNHVVHTFTFDAVILGFGGFIGTGTVRGALSLDAVVKGPVTGSFDLDAVITPGGSFTLDAVIEAELLGFTLDAWII